MKRTKIKNLAFAALFIMTAGFLASCGNNDDEDNGTISQQRIEKSLYGKQWFMRRWISDINEKTTYSFYRNHLVMSFTGIDKLTGGMLTYDNTIYFGTWQVQGNSLVSSFTSGTYKRDDMNDILYGTLTVTDLKANDITCTDPQGETHYLTYYESYGSRKRTFTDYTDDTEHDGALVGTWGTTAYRNNQPVEITLTVDKNGRARFTSTDLDVDFTTTCTTRNGHVTFDHYVLPTSGKYSFIYVRTDDGIHLYSEENAVNTWTWVK